MIKKNIISVPWYHFPMEYLRNKKATFDYELQDTYECGVELLGTEVKSIKDHKGSLSGAYVSVLGGELFLLGAHIPAWQEKNTEPGFDAYRSRKLLVHKKELLELAAAANTKGLTLLPVTLYGKGRHIKAQVAIAKGKKLFDKRDSLKKKAVTRDIERTLRD
jgi:SsrA-binding protein